MTLRKPRRAERILRCRVAGAAVGDATRHDEGLVPAEIRRRTRLVSGPTRKGETMTTAEMVAYAYDHIDQARAELNAVSK